MSGAHRVAHAQAEDAALGVETRFVVDAEVVPFAGHDHVGVAVQPQLHRPARMPCCDRRQRGDLAGLALLAAEAAAHAPARHDHILGVDAQRLRHLQLDLARMLGGRVHMHGAVVAGNRQCDLAFEVEVVLAAAAHRTAQPARCAGDGGIRLAAVHAHVGLHAAAGGQRVVDGQQGRQGGALGAGEARGAAGGVDRGRYHETEGLAVEADLAFGEDGIVVDHGAEIVGAGNVCCCQHRDHARNGARRVDVDCRQARVGVRCECQRRVQRAARLGQVVGVLRGARHVQQGGFMRQRQAAGTVRAALLHFRDCAAGLLCGG